MDRQLQLQLQVQLNYTTTTTTTTNANILRTSTLITLYTTPIALQYTNTALH